MKDERPNGIVHNSVNQSVACEIPPLTKGHLLIDQVVQRVMAVCNRPHDRGNIKSLAGIRTSLEKYMTTLEKETGVYWSIKRNPSIGTRDMPKQKYGHGRYRRDGFVVLEALDGWCFTIDGSTEHIGPHDTRADARTAGKKLMAELKRNAA